MNFGVAPGFFYSDSIPDTHTRQPESSRNREIPIIKLKQSVRKSHWLLVPSRLHEPESKNFS